MNDRLSLFLVEDLDGGKNIKYNNLGAAMFAEKATLLGLGRANFSAGAVVENYRSKGEFCEMTLQKIADLQDEELKKTILAVENISEILHSLVISFNADKRFAMTIHPTALGAKLFSFLSGKPWMVDQEEYHFGKFSLNPENGDCGVVFENGEKLECYLTEEGTVTLKDFVFKEIPTVVFDESPNACGGYDVKPDDVVFHGQIWKDIRYGDRVMAKCSPDDMNYEADKNESEEQRTMRETLDLYVPEKLQKENALILCIHGGSWTGGGKEGYSDPCKYYASLGYFAATINHSYVLRKYEDNGERVTFNHILQEIDAALRKIKQLSDEKGWEIKKAATTGYSSGSHLATWYAFAMGNRDDAPIPIVFTFSMVGPMSFRLGFWDSNSMPIGPQIASFYINDPDLFVMPTEEEAKQRFASSLAAGRHTLNEYDYTKYDPAAFDEKIDSISPLAYVKKGCAVPTILSECALDNVLISAKHGIEMEKALTEAGVDHKVIIFANSDHMGAGNAECGNVYRKYQEIFRKKYFGF